MKVLQERERLTLRTSSVLYVKRFLKTTILRENISILLSVTTIEEDIEPMRPNLRISYMTSASLRTPSLRTISSSITNTSEQIQEVE